MSDLIVMLTHNDKTVSNAIELFNQCCESKVLYWGIKDEPLSVDEMKMFFDQVHSHNKIGVLESITYTEEDGLNAVKKAIYCGCDILMGTKYFESINQLCKKNHIKYMPFIGKVWDCPSFLDGTSQEIASESDFCVSQEVFGVDYLAYRHVGNPSQVMKEYFTKAAKTRVCIAGSVDCFNRIDEILSLKADFFTIGSAFFENKFLGTFLQQINKVCEYIEGK